MKQNFKDFNVSALFVKPVNFDFSQGYLEKWEIAFELTEKEEENEEFWPMMNYYYWLPGFKYFSQDYIQKVKKLLKDLPLTLIYLIEEDEYGLALTGGGMDLSWQICEAYLKLNYLPPIHFCQLPRMAGQDLQSQRNQFIIQACLRSCEVAQLKIESLICDLKELR